MYLIIVILQEVQITFMAIIQYVSSPVTTEKTLQFNHITIHRLFYLFVLDIACNLSLGTLNLPKSQSDRNARIQYFFFSIIALYTCFSASPNQHI